MSVNRRSNSSRNQSRSRFRLLDGIERLEDRSLLAAFVPGNVAVYRIGNGTQTLSSNGNSVFVDEYTPSGNLVQSIALPDAGAGTKLIAHGLLTSEGMFSRASDGQSLVLPGYDSALGSLDSSAGRRTAGLIGVDGAVDLSTTGTFSNNGNFRSAFRHGDNIYTVGGASAIGVMLTTKGATTGGTKISSTGSLRSVAVFDGQLYVSTGVGSVRLGTIGNGVPTTGSQATTNLPGFPTSGSLYQFFFADLSSTVAGVDTLYVADDAANGGEIQKYSLSGGAWSACGTISAAAVRGLTGSVSGSTVTLFGATGGNSTSGGGSLYTFTDTTGYNASVSGTASTIATAAAKTVFRGVALAPDDGIGGIGEVAAEQDYLTGDVSVLLGGLATFSDQSSFKGGALTIDYVSGGTSEDTLSIVAGGDIVAASGSVFYNGTQIGSYPTAGVGSGLDGNGLTITFNGVLSTDSVGAAAVQALLRQLSFGTSVGASAGQRVIELQLQQNDGQSTSATTTVNVTRPNHVPTADDAEVSTDEDEAIGFTLSASDADGDSISYVITTGPAHGSLSGTAPDLTYTPDADFHGVDSVTFKVNDGNADSSEATISITVNSVNDAPIAADNSVSTDEDTALAAILTGNDAEGDSLTFVISSGPSHGQLSGDAPDLTYTPDANYHGSDSFTFKVNDGTVDSGEATISITVDPINDAPVLGSDLPKLFSIKQGNSNPYGTPVWMLVTDVTDVDVGDPQGQGIAIEGVTGSANGTWQYTIDNATNWQTLGTPSSASALVLKVGANNTRVRFVPNAGFSGTVALNYRAWDQSDGLSSGDSVDVSGEGATGGATAYSSDSRTGQLTVNNAPVLNAAVMPPLASILQDTANPYGTPVWQLGAGVSDVNAGALRGIAIEGVTGSADGTWQYTIDNAATWDTLGSPDAASALVLKANGNNTRLRFLPNSGFSGAVTLNYRAWDQSDGVMSGSTVDISAGGATGGTTAYSSASRAARLVVNDAPVMSTSVNPTLNTIARNTANPYGTPLWQLGLGISDKNSAAQRGIAIQGVTGSADGTWQYTLDGGTNWLSLGSPSLSSVRVLQIDGNRTRVRFVPNAGFSGKVSLDYRAWDLTDGTASGGTTDISAAGATGGATAYSKASRTALLTVNS